MYCNIAFAARTREVQHSIPLLVLIFFSVCFSSNVNTRVDSHPWTLVDHWRSWKMEEENIRRREQKLSISRQKPMHETVINGRTYTVLPEVFSPEIFLGTDWLAKTIPFPENGAFLEIGSGCGCLAAEAILTGKCRAVVACDINPMAIRYRCVVVQDCQRG